MAKKETKTFVQKDTDKPTSGPGVLKTGHFGRTISQPPPTPKNVKKDN